MDPCDDLTDEDIRTAIQNATGPKNVLFVPEVWVEKAEIFESSYNRDLLTFPRTTSGSI